MWRWWYFLIFGEKFCTIKPVARARVLFVSNVSKTSRIAADRGAAVAVRRPNEVAPRRRALEYSIRNTPCGIQVTLLCVWPGSHQPPPPRYWFPGLRRLGLSDLTCLWRCEPSHSGIGLNILHRSREQVDSYSRHVASLSWVDTGRTRPCLHWKVKRVCACVW